MNLDRLIVPHDRLLVQLRSKQKQTAGGIILPDEAQTTQRVGTVLKVGKSVIALDLEAGDEVTFGVHELSPDEVLRKTFFEDAEKGSVGLINWRGVQAVIKKAEKEEQHGTPTNQMP